MLYFYLELAVRTGECHPNCAGDRLTAARRQELWAKNLAVSSRDCHFRTRALTAAGPGRQRQKIGRRQRVGVSSSGGLRDERLRAASARRLRTMSSSGRGATSVGIVVPKPLTPTATAHFAQPGHPVQHRLDHRLGAASAVMGDGEAVRLVADPLQQVEALGGARQDERVLLPRDPDLLEPFGQAEALCVLGERIRALGKSIVVYSGYIYEQLIPKGESEPSVLRLLDLADLLIDGPYIEAQRDLSAEIKKGREDFFSSRLRG